jgi:hypothetical protein
MKDKNVIYKFYDQVLPDYYVQKQTGISCADLISGLPFNIGCIAKYVWRHERKDRRKDLEKAIQYTIMEIKDREEGKYRPVIDIDSTYYFKMIESIGNYEPKIYKIEIYRFLIIYLFCLKKDCLENLFNILEILKVKIEEDYPE